MTLPTKHKDGLRFYKMVLNHLSPSLCLVSRLFYVSKSKHTMVNVSMAHANSKVREYLENQHNGVIFKVEDILLPLPPPSNAYTRMHLLIRVPRCRLVETSSQKKTRAASVTSVCIPEAFPVVDAETFGALGKHLLHQLVEVVHCEVDAHHTNDVVHHRIVRTSNHIIIIHSRITVKRKTNKKKDKKDPILCPFYSCQDYLHLRKWPTWYQTQ